MLEVPSLLMGWLWVCVMASKYLLGRNSRSRLTGSVHIADAVPGAFTFLGIQNEEAGSVHGLHTARFQMDEAQMPLGAALHATVALDALNSHSAASKATKEEL